MFPRFLRYRFEYPALVVDSVSAILNQRYDSLARSIAFVSFVVLAAPAGLLIWAGSSSVTNALGLSIAVVLWPMVIDIAGRSDRRAAALGDQELPEDTFDKWWFWAVNIFGAVVIVALVVFSVDPLVGTTVDDGLLAGIALIWFLDGLRTAMAVVLASLDGFPLYLG